MSESELGLFVRVQMRDFRKWVRWHLRRYLGWNVKPQYWGTHVLFRFRKKKELELINYNRLQENLLKQGIADAKAVKNTALSNVRGFITASVPMAISGSYTPPQAVSGSYDPIAQKIERNLKQLSLLKARKNRYVYVPDDHIWIDIRSRQKVGDPALVRMLESTKYKVINPDSFSPQIVSDFTPSYEDHVEAMYESEINRLEDEVARYGKMKEEESMNARLRTLAGLDEPIRFGDSW